MNHIILGLNPAGDLSCISLVPSFPVISAFALLSNKGIHAHNQVIMIIIKIEQFFCSTYTLFT